MRPFHSAVALLLGLLALGCNGAPEPAAKPAPGPPEDRWGKASVGEFEISLPATWGKDSRTIGTDGWLFFGPEDDGFKPNAHLYWRTFKGPPDQWYRHMESKFGPENPLVEVRDRGVASIAGFEAHYLVYRQTDKNPKTGEPMSFLTIDWYFAGHGRGGIFRGVATERTFLWKYRPVFARMAAGLRYVPAR